MRKHMKTLIIIGVMTGTAVWGFQHVRFFDKLLIALNQKVFIGTELHGKDIGQGQGGYRGGRSRSVPQSQTHELPEPREQGRGGNGFGGMGQGGGHNRTASFAGWVNVTAYLLIFAFFIMLTYYGELGIRTIMQRREA